MESRDFYPEFEIDKAVIPETSQECNPDQGDGPKVEGVVRNTNLIFRTLVNINSVFRQNNDEHVSELEESLLTKFCDTSSSVAKDTVLDELCDKEGLSGVSMERYLVEKYLRHYKWYNPNRDNIEAPCLRKGWAYFDHFTLPRHFTLTKRRGRKNKVESIENSISGEKEGKNRRAITAIIKAPPGEMESSTTLYNPLRTDQEALSHFGIGVGMYFSTVSTVCVILFLAGLLSWSNMTFYSSREYDPDRFSPEKGGFPLPSVLKFSSVCMTREWVVCEGCQDHKSYWDTVFSQEHYGTAVDAFTEETYTLIRRYACKRPEFDQGLCTFAVIIFLILCMMILVHYQKKVSICLDQNQTTASDYSICVNNPPGDAIDPEEWKEYFNGLLEAVTGNRTQQVTLCTIALNNQDLLKKLIKRRQDLKALKYRLHSIVEVQDMNDEAAVEAAMTQYREEVKEIKISMMGRIQSIISTDPERLWNQIQVDTALIRKMQAEDTYEASLVFVTFETEAAQRTVLQAIDAGRIEVWTNRYVYPRQHFPFRGTYILDVSEGTEPSSLRWLDISASTSEIYLRQLATLTVTCIMIAISVITLLQVRVHVNTVLYSIILSTFNSLIATVVFEMMQYEKHPNICDQQASYYVNIVLFRWVNTVMITEFTTPFVSFLGIKSIDLMAVVKALCMSEMIYSPILKYLDYGFVERHFLAPRAKSKGEMFDCFNGSYYNMAERFTDFTKVLLLCVYYSAHFPFIYFFGAAILFIQYWTDKHLLLRYWQRQPAIGDKISVFSRKYFSTLAIVIGAMYAVKTYANFPYTDLCDATEGLTSNLMKAEGGRVLNSVVIPKYFLNVTLLNGEIIDSVEVTGTASFCNQDRIYFPFKKGIYEWMTSSQKHLAELSGLFAVLLLIAYIAIVFSHHIKDFFASLWRGNYEPSGYDQKKDFTCGIGVDCFGYVPQIQVYGHTFPFLACDVSSIDSGLIGWSPNNNDSRSLHKYDSHNLIFDVPFPKKMNGHPVFSIIKQWQPEWAYRARNNAHCSS